MRSDYVQYKLYKDKIKIKDFTKGTICYSNTFTYDWDYILVKIKTTYLTKEYLKFWLDLLKQIETKIEIKDNWIKLPYLKSKGKTLFILTIIRYLHEGEDANKYYDIVLMTKNIIDKHPNIDPLKAIVLASSCTERCSGWGHCIVKAVATKLPSIWHYRRFNSFKCHDLCNPKSTYPNNDLLYKLRKEKKDRYDVDPILKHFNIT